VPQYERVHAVEDAHWWFVGLRELVVATIVGLLPRGGRVLDAGCGTGRVLAALPERYQRVGVDVNRAVLEIARRQIGLELHEASLAALPFDDASFDAAFSLDVLSDNRLADPTGALRELGRVLRPAAPLVLNLPAYEFLRSGHDVAAQTARRYTASTTRDLLVAGGFDGARITYRMTLVFPVAAARRLLRRGGVDSDVGEVDPRVNRALTALLRSENRVLRRATLPFGLSVFAVARRAEPVS
jgi:ubiquinone/menaquinone biosynthesis C-methylase UbiE